MWSGLGGGYITAMAETSYQRGDKFLRVIQLFDQLQRTQRGRTTQELADELGVDRRSVQRYISQLQAAGLDIERDEADRYRVGSASRLPAMQFSAPEAVTVLVALRLMQQMRPAHDDALIGAVGRLAGALGISTVTSYLGTMLTDLENRPADGGGAGGDGPAERVLMTCFAQRIPCEIEYENAQAQTSRRVVRIYFLEPRPESRTVYVYGLDAKSKTMRWFRADRIRSARAVPIEGTYTVPDDFDIAEVTRSSWGIWQPGDALEEVVLRFSAAIAPRVRLSTWHPSAVLTDLEDGGVELRLRVASEVEMRPWVLGFGSLVEVVEPASLREHVAASMRAGARMYDGQVSSG